MDKIRLTNHIRDDELRIKMYRIIDLCNGVLKNYDVRQSEFLNPFEIKNAVSILNSEQDLRYRVEGGLENSERSVIVIFPFYHEYSEEDSSLKYLQVNGNFKFSSVSHRDYLGSLMGLGIKREKIGDIIVHDDFCQMVVKSDIADFIIYNYEKVANNRVSVREISKSDLVEPKQEFLQKSFSVSSLRVDNVISSVFGISRAESQKLINAEYVSVEYEKITSPTRQLDEGVLVSVRRKGRFYLSEIGHTTKKGKIKITVNLYKK